MTAWRQLSRSGRSTAAESDPRGRARKQKADDYPGGKLEPADRGALRTGGRFGVGRRNGGAEPRQRRLSEQRVEGRDEPIAVPPKSRVPLAQGLVLRQPLEQGALFVLVEFIVEQSGKPLVVFGHRTSYAPISVSPARPARKRAGS